MTRFLFRLIPIFAVVLLSGCASIIGHNKSALVLESDPPGAAVAVVDARGSVVAEGRTPLILTLKTRESLFQSAQYTVNMAAGSGEPVRLPLSGDFWSLDAKELRVDFSSGQVTRLTSSPKADTYLRNEIRRGGLPVGMSCCRKGHLLGIMKTANCDARGFETVAARECRREVRRRPSDRCCKVADGVGWASRMNCRRARGRMIEASHCQKISQ